jgi:hypothetical protein
MKKFIGLAIALAMVTGSFFASPLATAAGYKNADKTGASIAEFREEIISVGQEVDKAMAALDKIVQTADTDPRKAFKEFDKAVPRVESAAQKARKRADDMKARGKAYFEQWEKELASVKDPAIRELADQRKAKLHATFDAIAAVMTPAKEQFNTWLAGLKDLQTYLANDLTVGSIDEARPLIEKATTSGQHVQRNLDQIVAELNSVAATLTPAKVQKAK